MSFTRWWPGFARKAPGRCGAAGSTGTARRIGVAAPCPLAFSARTAKAWAALLVKPVTVYPVSSARPSEPLSGTSVQAGAAASAFCVYS